MNQSTIQANFYWSFITANLLHTNTAHLLLNLGGLSLLWAIHGYSYTVTNYLIQFLYFSLAVTLGMAFLSNNFAWYVGLSGVLHGTFIVGAYQDIRHRIKFGWWLMLGVWIKIIYEQVIGADENLQSLIEAQVAVDAHLYGAIAGSLWIGGRLVLNQNNRSTPKN
ncbi:rhombosortase [Aliiglaciecola sp. M165]|uniref:rhombosortase n=1 Tax=Aliiglaciecola sp. M165 TaxID=2593649 RepID=UPI0021B10A3B|nr:rhombosortase [Aliiglaciecola sp. M165]